MTLKRAGIVVGAAALVVVAIILWPRVGPGSSAGPLAAPPAAASIEPQGTVLLIPGYGGGGAPFDRLATSLRAQGIRSEVVDVGDGTGDLTTYAARVADRAEELIRKGQPAPDLIGYSAGGLTARVAETEQPQLFRRVITVGTPHAGTRTADLGAAWGECPEACQQMRTDSAFLQDLPLPADAADWLSIWSETDEVIRPSTSSDLAAVENYRLQSACAGAVDHAAIVKNPQTIAAIEAFLGYRELPDSCVAA